MSAGSTPAQWDTGFDRVLAFTVPGRNARGRVVRLGPVLDTILSAHAYPEPALHLLAEALVITALMGSLLKETGSQLTMQAQGEGGPVDMMVCDYRDSELRGYVQHDAERLAGLGTSPNLPALFKEGYLAITFDLIEENERYQGIVPLEGESLARACESYFEKSEQLPTLLRIGVRSEAGKCVAGGLLIQHLPKGEEGQTRLNVAEDHPEWDHVVALAGSVRHGELVDADLNLEQLVWRLFHEEPEVRVDPKPVLRRGCRCSADYYRTVLRRFPDDERASMRDADGLIPVDCAFCSRLFRIDA